MAYLQSLMIRDSLLPAPMKRPIKKVNSGQKENDQMRLAHGATCLVSKKFSKFIFSVLEGFEFSQ